MKVGIVGSRDFARLELVTAYVMSLPLDTVIVSGGARGVDTIAEQAASRRGLVCCVYKPSWKDGKGAGFARNGRIVAQSDRVVAFWDGKSRGTMDTVWKAYKSGKPVELRMEDGRIDTLCAGCGVELTTTPEQEERALHEMRVNEGEIPPTARAAVCSQCYAKVLATTMPGTKPRTE